MEVNQNYNNILNYKYLYAKCKVYCTRIPQNYENEKEDRKIENQSVELNKKLKIQKQLEGLSLKDILYMFLKGGFN